MAGHGRSRGAHPRRQSTGRPRAARGTLGVRASGSAAAPCGPISVGCRRTPQTRLERGWAGRVSAAAACGTSSPRYGGQGHAVRPGQPQRLLPRTTSLCSTSEATGTGQVRLLGGQPGSGRATRQLDRPPGRASAGPMTAPRGPVRRPAFICLVLRASMGANKHPGTESARQDGKEQHDGHLAVGRGRSWRPGPGDRTRGASPASREFPRTARLRVQARPGPAGAEAAPPGTGYGQPGYGQPGPGRAVTASPEPASQEPATAPRRAVGAAAGGTQAGCHPAAADRGRRDPDGAFTSIRRNPKATLGIAAIV